MMKKGVNGGGIAIGVCNILDPSWLSEGDDEAEAMAVEIWIEGFPIRLICGYGPQEYDLGKLDGVGPVDNRPSTD